MTDLNGAVPLDPKPAPPTLDELIDRAVNGDVQTFTRPNLEDGEERPVAVLVGYEQYLSMRKATTLVVGLYRTAQELGG